MEKKIRRSISFLNTEVGEDPGRRGDSKKKKKECRVKEAVPTGGGRKDHP